MLTGKAEAGGRGRGARMCTKYVNQTNKQLLHLSLIDNILRHTFIQNNLFHCALIVFRCMSNNLFSLGLVSMPSPAR